MDKVVLKGLRFRGLHGYYEDERRNGNDFEVDLTFILPLESAARNDDLSQTADYQKAQEIVASVMNGKSVKLIETLAFRIGEQLNREFSDLHSLEVTVRKLNPPIGYKADYSEVTMKWPR